MTLYSWCNTRTEKQAASSNASDAETHSHQQADGNGIALHAASDSNKRGQQNVCGSTETRSECNASCRLLDVLRRLTIPTSHV